RAGMEGPLTAGPAPRPSRRAAPWNLASLLLLPAGLLLIAFLAVPLCAMVWLSLTPNNLVHFQGHGLGNYAYLLAKPYYRRVALRTFRIAIEATVVALLIGYPTALALRAVAARVAGAITLAMTLPILSGPLVVVLGWMILLSDGGPVFAPLARWDLIPRFGLLGSETGIVIGIVHFVLPFVVLSLASVLRNIPAPLLEAASSLGAGAWQRFVQVILPLSLPGVLSAAVIALSLSMSSFIAPHYLGGPSDLTLTTLVAQFVLATYDGQMAAAVSVVLLVAMAGLILLLTTGLSRRLRR
ncbi:MAG TPA: ABC transporter permease, partial [Rhodopila sp.]|uniref:ABC transporter permease n=1 Tax=Rhodopila sp. TaxID=2480087 RepID=UPI002BB46A72